MKKSILTTFLLLMALPCICQQPQWGRLFGADGNQNVAWSSAISCTHNGHSFVSGLFVDSLHLGNFFLTSDSTNTSNGFITEIDPDGNVLWAEKFTTHGYVEIFGMIVDGNGNIYLSGIFGGDIKYQQATVLTSSTQFSDYFLLKLNASHHFEWATCSFGYVDNICTSMAEDSRGNICLAGRFGGTMVIDGDTLHSTGEWDGFIIKFNPNGSILHYELTTGPDNDFFDQIKFDDEDNLFAIGTFAYSCTHSPLKIVHLDSLTLYGASHPDLGNFLVKYDTAFNAVWVKQTSAMKLEVSHHSIYTAGCMVNNLTIDNQQFSQSNGCTKSDLLLKYDSDGNLVWHRIFGSEDIAYPVGLTIWNDQLYFAGTFKGDHLNDSSATLAVNPSTNFQWDDYCEFILRMDTIGNISWVYRYNTTDTPDAIQFGFDSGGSCIVAGTTRYGGLFLNDTDPLDTIAGSYLTSQGQGSLSLIKFNWIEDVHEVTQANFNNAFTSFPNPSNGKFQIHGDFPTSSSLHFYDVNGKEVIDPVLSPQGSNSVSVDLDVPQGIYFYQVISGERLIASGKLVFQ
jgi:hypothetical protein